MKTLSSQTVCIYASQASKLKTLLNPLSKIQLFELVYSKFKAHFILIGVCDKIIKYKMNKNKRTQTEKGPTNLLQRKTLYH